MVEYVTGDLFDIATSDSYLLHACNTQGVWSAGIAKQFSYKYPKDFEVYVKHCEDGAITGTNLVTPSNIICMFTSEKFGWQKDTPEIILNNTKRCLSYLAIGLPYNTIIYSPKINSGLFMVPWLATEKLINDFLLVRPDVKWIVCEIGAL